jgi:hypothetical protein
LIVTSGNDAFIIVASGDDAFIIVASGNDLLIIFWDRGYCRRERGVRRLW